MNKLTNKMVEGFLFDCLGYDELMIDEFKCDYKVLSECLEDYELQDCKEYYGI